MIGIIQAIFSASVWASGGYKDNKFRREQKEKAIAENKSFYTDRRGVNRSTLTDGRVSFGHIDPVTGDLCMYDVENNIILERIPSKETRYREHAEKINEEGKAKAIEQGRLCYNGRDYVRGRQFGKDVKRRLSDDRLLRPRTTSDYGWETMYDAQYDVFLGYDRPKITVHKSRLKYAFDSYNQGVRYSHWQAEYHPEFGGEEGFEKMVRSIGGCWDFLTQEEWIERYVEEIK